MKLFAVSFAAAALFASASANAAVVELVKNGSFESNAIGQGWTLMSNLDGWSVWPAQVEVRNNVSGAASEGSVYLELDGNSNTSISQSIATTAGMMYSISFDYSPREWTNASTNGIELMWGGQSYGVFSANSNSAGNHWQRYTLQLAGIGPATALEFRGVGASDSIGGSLDNVSVTRVPEPGTLAIVALGLGMLGITLRRKA